MKKLLLAFLASKIVFLPMGSLAEEAGKREREWRVEAGKAIIGEVITSDYRLDFMEEKLSTEVSGTGATQETCPYFEIKQSWPVYELMEILEVAPKGKNVFGELIYEGKAEFFKRIKVFGRCNSGLEREFGKRAGEEKEKKLEGKLERIVVEHPVEGLYICLGEKYKGNDKENFQGYICQSVKGTKGMEERC